MEFTEQEKKVLSDKYETFKEEIEPVSYTHLIGYYEKHEFRNAETMEKYDLW